MGSPTETELKALYDAAIVLRELKPWYWIYATQVFIIKDKETGIEGFCNIMGMNGQYFSFSVYLGEEGYRSYKYLYDKSQDSLLDHVLLKGEVRRHCLSVSYENIDHTSEVDVEQAKVLGFNFSEDEQWPKFRYHKPGIYSWYIEDDWQCRFLTEAIKQATLIIRLARQGNIAITELDSSSYFMRYYTEQGWKMRYIDSDHYKVAYKTEKTPFKNNLLGYRIKKLPKYPISLEAIIFYLPNPVMFEEKSQPFYMQIIAIVDSVEGQLFFLDIQEQPTIDHQQILNDFGKRLLELEVKPDFILVEDEEGQGFFEDFCKQIEVELLIEKIPQAHQFAQYIYEELDINITNRIEFADGDDDGDAIDRLIFFTDQIYSLFLDQGTLHHLSTEAVIHYKKIIQTFILAMYTEKKQIPTDWKPDAVKEICKQILPEQLEPSVLKVAKEVLSHFITILGEDGILEQYKAVLLVVNNCI